MKATLFSFLIVSLLLVSLHKPGTKMAHPDAFATDTLHWETETCTHIGTFDKSKYTKKQLREMYKLWFVYSSPPSFSQNFVFDPKKYYEFDSEAELGKLERGCMMRHKQYARMNLPEGSVWDDLRKNRMKNLNEYYALAKTELQAHKDPRVLLDSRFSKSCTQYAEALASKDTMKLMASWGSLMKEREAGNFSEALFIKNKNSLTPENRIAYARTYLMAYGWHNCANRQIDHEIPNVNYQQEFEKLFIKVETECDEP